MSRAIGVLLLALLSGCADEAEMAIREQAQIARICADGRVVLIHQGQLYGYFGGGVKPYAAGVALGSTCAGETTGKEG